MEDSPFKNLEISIAKLSMFLPCIESSCLSKEDPQIMIRSQSSQFFHISG